ncbi:Uma2 family endonuclease [Amycolatopsis sp. MtRt-6]|uniref:Uma2 family endonuclease n=1 Tax=Amycolatopsis sp. MtRt-6 TaxID=2792782 RepID=UPI001A8E8549|nr:Uma2 family endonuclease [Amycolatopsis sp. MtRt-6]
MAVTPVRLLTIEEYAALGETEVGYTELVEGRVVISPNPSARHNLAAFSLARQLDPQLPPGLTVILGIDVDLQLAPAGQPGFSRRPDLLIFDKAALARGAEEMLRADEVAAVVEVVSPASERTDYRVKHDEYADAGIPHYWIIDTSEPISLVACHQAGEFGYLDAAAVTGTFVTDVPFPVKIDLTALLD